MKKFEKSDLRQVLGQIMTYIEKKTFFSLDIEEYSNIFIDTECSAKRKCTASFEEGFPSGQRDQTVNLTAPPSEVRILPPPPFMMAERSEIDVRNERCL